MKKIIVISFFILISSLGHCLIAAHCACNLDGNLHHRYQATYLIHRIGESTDEGTISCVYQNTQEVRRRGKGRVARAGITQYPFLWFPIRTSATEIVYQCFLSAEDCDWKPLY